jgi:hypothetical protein
MQDGIIIDDMTDIIWLCDYDNSNYEELERDKIYNVYFHDDTEFTSEFRSIYNVVYLGAFEYYDYFGPCLEFHDVDGEPGEIWRLATGEVTVFIQETW